MSIISCGNEHLDRVLFSQPSSLLLYGSEGVGKTNLVLTIIKLSSPSIALYISTEGSNYIERANQLGLLERDDVLFAEALDEAHLAQLLARASTVLKKHSLLVIDSLNYHYRGEVRGIESLRFFLSMLSFLKQLSQNGVYVVATAQVREGENGRVEIPGMQLLIPWADVVARVDRTGDKRILTVEKPVNIVAEFRITNHGIEWINVYQESCQRATGT